MKKMSKFKGKVGTYNNYGKKLVLSEVFISFFVCFVILLSKVIDSYELLFCLPLSFGLLLILFFRMYFYPLYNYGIGFWIINIVMFIRYTITPVMIVLTGSYYHHGPNPAKDSMSLAIFIMIYEMIISFIVIRLAAQSCRESQRKLYNFKPGSYTIFKPYFLVGIFAAFAAIILIPYPQLLIPQELFIISEQYTRVTVDATFDGALIIISRSFKIVLLLFALGLFKKMYDERQSAVFVYLSGLACLIFIGLNTGTSRWTVLIWTLISVVILTELYPRQGKLIRNIIIIVSCVSIVSISMYKFSWAIVDAEKPVIQIFSLMATQFQSYFSGPHFVAQAIEMKELFKNSISLGTLVNDFIGSIPFISNYVNQGDRLNVYFNLYNFQPFGRTSLIVPMVGCGYAYLGLILAPIFTALCEFGAVKFDYFCKKERRVEFKMIYFYACFWLSLCMAFNIQIVFGFFVTTFIPLWILFYCNKKFVLKKVTNKDKYNVYLTKMNESVKIRK